MNAAKTKQSPPPKIANKTLTLVREATDGGVKATYTGERQDGTAIHYSFSAKYDGKDYPVTGNSAWDTISLKQIDANTFAFEAKKTGGKYHMTGRNVISNGGKTSTLTSKGTNAEGQPTSGTLVYDKQ